MELSPYLRGRSTSMAVHRMYPSAANPTIAALTAKASRDSQPSDPIEVRDAPAIMPPAATATPPVIHLAISCTAATAALSRASVSSTRLLTSEEGAGAPEDWAGALASPERPGVASQGACGSTITLPTLR